MKPEIIRVFETCEAFQTYCVELALLRGNVKQAKEIHAAITTDRVVAGLTVHSGEATVLFDRVDHGAAVYIYRSGLRVKNSRVDTTVKVTVECHSLKGEGQPDGSKESNLGCCGVPGCVSHDKDDTGPDTAAGSGTNRVSAYRPATGDDDRSRESR